jgi:PepSY-associated TM region
MIKTNNFFSFLYHWHQRIGLVVGVAIIAWALSGLAHPIITRLNPTPAQMMPPNDHLNLNQISPINSLWIKNSLHQIHSLRLFQWQDKAVYRITSSKGNEYFYAQTHNLIDKGESIYAEYLARYFSGDTSSEIIAITQVTEFDEDYLSINRFLPVMRVEFKRTDGLRVYVDTAQGRLATMVDDRKKITSQFFRYFHSWEFIDNSELRKSLMLIFLFVGFSLSLMGLWLYIKSKKLGTFRKEHPFSRRLHRSLGIAVVIPALFFSFSGLLHVIFVEDSDHPQKQHQLIIDTQGIDTEGIALDHLNQFLMTHIKSIQLTQIDNHILWQIIPASIASNKSQDHHNHNQTNQKNTANKVLYLDAKSSAVFSNGNELLTRYLASQLTEFPNEKISKIETVTSFTGEYGFINKRLPVAKVTYDLPSNPSVYIETSSNTLAGLVKNPARIEGYSFAYLHKWHFLDFLGKNLRDLITSLIALGIVLLVSLGVYRYNHRR